MDAFSLLALMKANSGGGKKVALSNDLAELIATATQTAIYVMLSGGQTEGTAALVNQTAIHADRERIAEIAEALSNGKAITVAFPMNSSVTVNIVPSLSICNDNGYYQIQLHIPLYDMDEYWFAITIVISTEVIYTNNSLNIYVKQLRHETEV